MTFSETAWAAIAPSFAGICEHPFIRGLSDGTLAEATFVRYLCDDAHYLDRYARTLAMLAARAPDPAGVELLAASAVGAISAERQLHRGFLLPRGVDPDGDGAVEATSTCRGYTGFLTALASSGPFDVAVAAVLPCFRVYAEVGRFILALRPAGEHPYAAWIDTYAAPEFDRAVRDMEAYVDSIATDRTAMLDAYRTATRWEKLFWDAAWAGPARTASV